MDNNNNHKLQQVLEDYQPGNRLKEGTPIFILLLVQPKVWKKGGTTHQQRQLSAGFVDAILLQKTFSCWWNRPTCTFNLRTSRTYPLTTWHYITPHDDIRSLSSVDGTWLERQHDYWSRLRQLHTPFYSKTMARDGFSHILCFLHFADNSQRPEQEEEYDRLWKLQMVFDTLVLAYAKFYNPSENLTKDEVIVKFKGRLFSGSIFQRN